MRQTRYFVVFYETGKEIEIRHELLVGDVAHYLDDDNTIEGTVTLRWYDADTDRFIFEVEGPE